MATTQLLLDGQRFAECPRWHDGKLWFSDIFAHRVITVDESGASEVVVELHDGGLPAGLGFLPDGRLLFVDMHRPVVRRLEPDGRISIHADLSHLAVGGLNDMVVDDDGRAYVGSMGTHRADVPRPVDADGNVIVIEPDGSARIVADGLDAPNGPIITNDGQQYVVAEFPSARLAGFRRHDDGSLTDRHVWADLSPGSADGITVDHCNGIWTASPRQSRCRRVVHGGEITDEIEVDASHMPLACCLGGDDGRTLFILSAVGGEERIRQRTNSSVIETARVDVAAW